MDFIEELRNLSVSINDQTDLIQTEAATKTVCVLPFIDLLGYDTHNLREVVPEYTADMGIKQGEKVDYAIKKDNEVIMLIECKKYGEDLSDVHASQLHRYFSAVHARIAVLTNGVLYHFYTDLKESNIMDSKPFLEFNMLDIQPPLVNELKRFTKTVFDLDKTLTAANNLKYTKGIKQMMIEQLDSPSEDFVKFFMSSVYSGVKTQAVVQQFTDIVKRALNQFFNEEINHRLQSAIREEEIAEKSDDVDESIDEINKPQQDEKKITCLHVTMPDGKVINHSKAKDTFVDVVIELGLEEVMRFFPKVVSKEPFFSDNEQRAASTVQSGEFYINTRSSTKQKKRILEKSASKLNIQLKVDILERGHGDIK